MSENENTPETTEQQPTPEKSPFPETDTNLQGVEDLEAFIQQQIANEAARTEALRLAGGMLNDHHKRILTERAVALDVAVAAGLRTRIGDTVEFREHRKKYKLPREREVIEDLEGECPFPVDALFVPYPRDYEGHLMSWRLRYDQTTFRTWSEEMDTSGVSGGWIDAPCPRYQSKPGVPVCPYIPALLDSEEAKRTFRFADDEPLFITEAPLKCLSLYSHRYKGIGLGGVLAGCHQKRADKRLKVTAHDQVKRVRWHGRRVYTAFDAGQTTNPMVALGVAYCWQALSGLDAEVYTVTIPERTDGKTAKDRDQGPDDFLYANGDRAKEAFQRLVDDAYPTDPLERVKSFAGLPASERTSALIELSKDLVFRACLHVSSRADHQLVVAASKRVLSAALIKEAVAEFRASMVSKAESPDDSWKSDLCRAGNGSIRPIGQNVELCLRHDPGLDGMLAFDLFLQNLKFRKAPPWLDHYTASADVVDGTWWAAEDYTRLSYHVGRVHNLIDVPTSKVEDAVMMVAREHAYHPVQDYLRGLQWDGVPRVDTVLQDHLGVPHGPYARLASRLFLLQAAARVMKPGCKADLVLVLEGDQGVGKSTFLRVLFGDEWFTDEPLGDLADKETAMKLQGHWCVELGEGEILAKASQKALKSFTAKLFDAYVPKYSNVTTRVARQSVFVVTINDSEYLTDTTGNRRYLPVECAAREINMECVQLARGQLWAEAVHRLGLGEKWHLTREDQLLFASQTEARMVEDPWLEKIQDFLERGVVGTDDDGNVQPERLELVSILDVLKGIEESRGAGRRESNRVSDCLRRLGWHSPRDSAEHSRAGVRLWSPSPTRVVVEPREDDSPSRLRKCGTAAHDDEGDDVLDAIARFV